ncbi:hypothetical protein KIN20_011926 [Parelaphostrongylus tenuis]|uniref:C2H2-type domain-containing protein n=1 Tax=Parelaphostrongylus tenuis TaxID=148309 RepID=A0AAD5MEQ0_PARTN|nr:hypothetical protein KIN20_011926 [Parelaphostrongylus tenuis]
MARSFSTGTERLVKEERDDDSPIVEEQFPEGSVCYAMDLLNNASSSADIPENGLLFDNMPSDEEKVLKILHDADVNPEKTNEKAPLGVSVCKECDMMFPSEHRLRKHISVHHLNERNFTCWCGQKFGSRSGMNRHKQVVHRNHVLMCPYEGCDHPGYKCSKALTAHIRSVHTNVRPYLCDTCGKTFISGSQLKIHLRTHSDDVFQCKCGITFRRFIRLKKHQQLCLLI